MACTVKLSSMKLKNIYHTPRTQYLLQYYSLLLISALMLFVCCNSCYYPFERLIYGQSQRRLDSMLNRSALPLSPLAKF